MVSTPDNTLYLPEYLILDSKQEEHGLQVAQLAGVPTDVITAAKLKLWQLEQTRYQGEAVKNQPQPDLFAASEQSELEKRMQQINPDELSPKQALDLIYELIRLAKENS